MDNQQLTPTDRQLLAREVAADRFEFDDSVELGYEECGCRDIYYTVVESSVVREGVKHGWDAAMEYVKQEAECGKA